MKISLFHTFRPYKKEYLPKDILTGIIIALVSIPISMGYAEVAGLPAVYGLYGSVLPILLFSVFSTSRQFILGVDAAPAAIVGSALAALGIQAQSPQAMQYVPLIAICSGLWLLLFYILKAGKIVNYISTPVMGGFISGIALTIILMQIPKILGGTTGSGELLELLHHLGETITHELNLLSVLLGLAALICIRLAKKYIPRFPMAVVMMGAGVAATCLFHVDRYGVRLLSAVEPGLPKLFLPDLSQVEMTHVVGRGLMVAVVVMAETLLSENNFASRNGYQIDENQEILACAAGNIAAGVVGCCPVNGSISRTSMSEQYGGKTQAVSVTAGLTMTGILLFATGFIGYLPVPVLAAIVISALMNVVEFELAKRLFLVSRKEFYIFVAACLGVLLLGTIYGVIIGILLSFIAVILKATNPPRAFLGVIPGRENFYDLKKNRHAHAISQVVIYRFSESLFFANARIFTEDIEASLKEDTRAVIVDAGAVNSIDITAADSLEILAGSLKKRGIRFYLTEHGEGINGELRKLGKGHLIQEGAVRRTITAALHDAGFHEPYPLLDLEREEHPERIQLLAEEENSLEEFAWAFGEEAVEQIEKKVHHMMDYLQNLPDLEWLSEHGLPAEADDWKEFGAIDEDEVLRRLEMHLDELPKALSGQKKLVMELLEKRRRFLVKKLEKEDPQVLEKLRASREILERRLEKQNPEAARKLHKLEESWREKTEAMEAGNSDHKKIQEDDHGIRN